MPDIEHYLDENGSDTRFIKNIALSTVVPKALSVDKENLVIENKLVSIPLHMNMAEELSRVMNPNAVWSFTMMIKESGDQKLLFSSQEDAEKMYLEIIKG